MAWHERCYRFEGVVAADEAHVLPGGDEHVLRQEVLGADDRLADVPLDALAYLDAHLVGARRQVTLQSARARGG